MDGEAIKAQGRSMRRVTPAGFAMFHGEHVNIDCWIKTEYDERAF